MIIHILTYSPSPEQIYGNVLALKTGRIGFPNTEIHVTDNASCPEAREIFKQLSKEHGYHYDELEEEVSHPDFIQSTVNSATGPITFIDPDVVFWSSCEHLFDSCEPGKLTIRGRLLLAIAQYFCASGKLYLCMPRLHTSFLIISDPQVLVRHLELFNIDWNPWSSRVFRDEFVHRRYYDTACYIYQELKLLHVPFTSEELDLYDHITSGTHLNRILKMGPDNLPDKGAYFKGPHEIAMSGDYQKLKGLWKEQEKDYQALNKRVPAQAWLGTFR